MKHFLLYITLLITLNGAAQQFRLEITAQDSLSKKVLDSIKPGELYKDYKAASESLEALSKKLAQLGYFENSISPITKTSDSLFNSTLSIGNQYENILVLTYKLDQRSLEYMSITQDTLVLKPEQVERFMNNNLTIWFEKGFSFATLQLTNLKKVSPSSISATLEVDTKELRKIDHIIVKGYEQFPKPFKSRPLIKRSNSCVKPLVFTILLNSKSDSPPAKETSRAYRLESCFTTRLEASKPIGSVIS